MILGHPEKIVDFGHRAIHEMTLKAKAVVEVHYGEVPRRSYFASCSNGGRQALMEAQRYPADYDGLVAGAPAASWTGLFAGFLWNAQLMADPAAYVPAAKLPAIERAVIAACDRADLVPDGVLASPRTCRFDPRSIACKGAVSSDCLTPPQADALAKVYAGPGARAGRGVLRGFPPGAETGPGGWGLWITGEAPGRSLQTVFASQIGASMAFDRPDWDLRTYEYQRDQPVVEARLARTSMRRARTSGRSARGAASSSCSTGGTTPRCPRRRRSTTWRRSGRGWAARSPIRSCAST